MLVWSFIGQADIHGDRKGGHSYLMEDYLTETALSLPVLPSPLTAREAHQANEGGGTETQSHPSVLFPRCKGLESCIWIRQVWLRIFLLQCQFCKNHYCTFIKSGELVNSRLKKNNSLKNTAETEVSWFVVLMDLKYLDIQHFPSSKPLCLVNAPHPQTRSILWCRLSAENILKQ